MSPADTKSILVFLTHESVNIPTMMPHPYVSIKDTTGITLILKKIQHIWEFIFEYYILQMWYQNCSVKEKISDQASNTLHRINRAKLWSYIPK